MIEDLQLINLFVTIELVSFVIYPLKLNKTCFVNCSLGEYSGKFTLVILIWIKFCVLNLCEGI